MGDQSPPQRAIVFVPLLIGVIGLSTLMQRPGFELFHAVDVVQLLGSGMCFGVAFSGLVAMIRGRR